MKEPSTDAIGQKRKENESSNEKEEDGKEKREKLQGESVGQSDGSCRSY